MNIFGIIKYDRKVVEIFRDPVNIIEYPAVYEKRLKINLGFWRHEWKWKKRVIRDL